jgi:uncharacterized membrane-anchored protein YhcB (DUF1043 family)
MIAVIVFCLGCLLGALVSRSFFPPEQQKQLEDSLQTSREELEQYQREVAQHFADTAKLVQNLTASYKDVHDHLAGGALKLTNPEITQQVLAAGDKSIGVEVNEELEDQHVEAPKDWAPKTPGQAGTLSEDYGLDNIADNDFSENDVKSNKL